MHGAIAVTSKKTPESKAGHSNSFSYLILLLFLCSGMTGLLYEVIWTRMIVKVIGAAPFAVSIVLTVFMAGLGLGSYLAGTYIDRIKKSFRLLQLYSLLEIGIGLYASLLPGLIKASEPLFSTVYNHTSEHLLIFNIFVLLGSVILFIVPVTLMGATLPILMRYYVAKIGHLGTRTGRLYAINTFGAAAGSILAGFLLINFWGVGGTLFFAVLVNFIIGAVALLLSFQVAKTTSSDLITPIGRELKEQDPVRPSNTPFTHSHQVAVLIIFGVSGFAAMAYEVIWTRLLGLIIGPTTYSFTIVLTTFILGLALGATLFGWIADRSRQPFRLLLLVQFAAAMFALMLSQFLGNSQFFFAKLIFTFKDDFVMLSFMKALLLFLLLVGPTIVLGATFPLVVKIYTRSINQLGRSIGFAYAMNTIGALLGSFLAGFILIPFLGKEHSLSFVVGLQLITTLSVFGYFYRKVGSSPQKIGIFGVFALSLLLTLIYPHWDRQQLAMGKYYRFSTNENKYRHTSWWDAFVKAPAELAPASNGIELVFYGDGMGGFTTVKRDIDPMGNTQLSLYNSGKADASTHSDMSTQTLSAHIPMLFHPDPKEVMILGLASGVTAGEVLYYDPDHLDILEISEQVVEASKYFSAWNNHVLCHPETNVIIQDGRAHLELSAKKYDVIISEPSNPWMAGLASLFTKDFFQLAKNRLDMDGIFVQWLPSYQMDWTTFSMIGRTFASIFPNSLLMRSSIGGNDYFLIGFKGLEQLSITNGEKNLAKLQKSPNIVVDDPRLLYRLLVSDDLVNLFGPGPVHSDDHPLLEFMAPRRMHLRDGDVRKILSERRTLSKHILNVIQSTLDVEDQLQFTRFALSLFSPFLQMVDLDAATQSQRESFYHMMLDYARHHTIDSYDIFGDDSLKTLALETQVEILTTMLPRIPKRLGSYIYLANATAELGDFEASIRYARLIVEFSDDPIEANLNLGQRYLDAGDYEKAIAVYETVMALDPANSFALNNLGAAYEKSHNIKAARETYELAIQMDPKLGVSHYNLARFHAASGELDSALQELQLSIALNPGYIPAYLLSSDLYTKKGAFDQAAAELETILKVRPDIKDAQIKLQEIRSMVENTSISQIFLPDDAEFNGSADPRYYYNQALTMLHNQDYRSAVVPLNQAISLKEDYLKAIIALGAVYQELDKLDEAISQYQNALALDPQNGGTHNNLALIYYHQKDYKLAIEHADKAQALGFQVQQTLLDKLREYR